MLNIQKAGQDSRCSIRKGKQSACSFSKSDSNSVSDGGRAALCPPLFPQDRHSDFHQHSTPVHPALTNPHAQNKGSQVGNFVVTSTTWLGRPQILYPGCSERSQKAKDAVGVFYPQLAPWSSYRLLTKSERGYFLIEMRFLFFPRTGLLFIAFFFLVLN